MKLLTNHKKDECGEYFWEGPVSLIQLTIFGVGLTTVLSCSLLPGEGEQKTSDSGKKSAIIGGGESKDWEESEAADSPQKEQKEEKSEEMDSGQKEQHTGELETEEKKEKKNEDEKTKITGWLRVSSFEFSYLSKRASFPPIERIIREPVKLGIHQKGYTAPYQSKDGSTKHVDLSQTFLDLNQDFSEERGQFTPKAIRYICSQLLSRLKNLGYMGVMVSPHPDDVSREGKDLRTDRNTLRIMFYMARIGNIHSIARGDRLVETGENKIINHPVHRWIREQSPVSEKEVMRRTALRDYVHWLNRHPGRRVDLEVSGTDKQGEALLGYRITENRPWTVFTQISDTGTEQSGEVQTRSGFIHNQLTGEDDILSVSYLASGLDDEFKRVDSDLGDLSPNFQAGNVSYDRPLLYPGSRTRLQVVGRWNKFTSSDVGLLGNSFTGETWSLGSEVRHNLWQWEDYFVDGYAGLTFKRDRVKNDITGIETGEPFLVPGVGLEGETSSQVSQVKWRASAEWNLDKVVDTDPTGVERLGRVNADPSWKKLTFDYRHSQYLEPLLYKEWSDPSTSGSTLAHEVRFNARGQLGLDRMNPNEIFVAGGMHTVRGYPESAVSADSGFTTTFEYRFHLPRILPIEREPATIPWIGDDFRRTPQNVFGMPDWDWVFKGFIDYGAVEHEDRIEQVESDETLLSVGVGTELQFKEHMRFRVDWGWPMRGLESRPVEAWNSEAHFLFTLMY